MENYEILRTTGSPDWQQIPALEVRHYQWQKPMDISMKAQLCYDETNLYLHLRAWEREIRAEHTQPLSMVCEDSCMEFFLRPMENDLRYFNFEINPNACMFVGFGNGKENLIRLCPSEDTLQARTALSTDGWTAFFQIPFTFIQVFFPDFLPTPGKLLRANCYKCAQKAPVPHFITWNAVNSDVPSFHRPNDFGAMRLE